MAVMDISTLNLPHLSQVNAHLEPARTVADSNAMTSSSLNQTFPITAPFLDANVTEDNDSSHENQMSFTPRRSKAPPRAWERMPAKPFIPRNEGQKIWKRVPLGELGVESTSNIISRKEQNQRDDYVRVVKKLKVREGDEDDAGDSDKENATSVSKKSKPKSTQGLNGATVGFVGTKLEGDHIEKNGSPKKKARMMALNQNDMAIAGPSDSFQTDQKSQNEVEDAGPLSGLTSEAANPAHHVARPEAEDVETLQQNVHSTPTSDSDNVAESTHISTSQLPGTDTNSITTVDNDDETSMTFENTPSARTVESDSSSKSDSRSLHENCGGSAGLPSTTNVASFIGSLAMGTGDQSSQDYETIPADSGTALEDAEEDVSISSSEHVEYVTAPDQEFEDAILAVTSECLSPTDKTSETKTPQERSEHGMKSVVEVNPFSGHGNMFTTQTLPTIHKADYDETAFLHEFLSRAKAQKAAKDVVKPKEGDTDTFSTVDMLPSENVTDVTSSVIEVSPMKDNLLFLTIPASPESTRDESNQGSPLRRSTRAAARLNNHILPSSSIPVPSTIQLRRATGTEFIFNVNRAQTQANAAMLTRTNTQKNKGGALCVLKRLEELRSDHNDVKLVNTAETGEVFPRNVLTTNGGEENVESEKQSKRRRRNKDGTRKIKKTLSWKEELVEFREASPAQREDCEGSFQGFDEFLTKDSDWEKDTNTIMITNVTNSTLEADKQTTEADTAAKLKVRKIRRAKAGSVNGTPAPKSRSKEIDDENTLPIIGSDVLSIPPTDTAQSKPITSRKSRMPIPSHSTGLSLKFSSVANSSARRATGPPVPEEALTSTRTFSDIPKRSESENKVDSRRRLRIRN